MSNWNQQDSKERTSQEENGFVITGNWIAGVVEAEGSFGITLNVNKNNVVSPEFAFQIDQKDPEFLEKTHDFFSKPCKSS